MVRIPFSVIFKSVLPAIKNTIFILFPLTCLCQPLLPLDPQKGLKDAIVTILTTKDGLPQNTVHRILQDKNGYIWIGTGQGLARYNGYNFKILNKFTTWEIKNNSITSMMISQKDELWFGTFGGGLVMLKDDKFKHFTAANGLTNDFIWTITEDHRQNIWIGSHGGGLFQITENGIKNLTMAHGLSDNIVFAIIEDGQERLWIGTENGLNCLERGKFKTYRVQDGLPDNKITTLCIDHQGTLWIGTLNGLSRLKDDKFRNYSTQDGLSSNLIRQIYEDVDHNLWIATNLGLSRIRNGKIDVFTTRHGLSDNCLMALFEDREGNFWVGTSGKGLNIFHPSKFNTITTSEGLSLNYINVVIEDKEGNIWIGTNGGGLNRISNGNIRFYKTEDGLTSNFIYSLFLDNNQTLWIGTDKGLNQLSNGTISKISYYDQTRQKDITVIFQDSKGKVWLGTDGQGLMQVKNNLVRTQDEPEGLSNPFINSIQEDAVGNLWVGTNQGLNVLKDGKFRTYTIKDGLSEDTIYDIYIDKKDTIWLATNGGGLCRFKNNTFFTYTIEQGLYANDIYRILPDETGNLWMSTNKGIFSISLRDLAQLKAGEIEYLNCKFFHESDGMKSAVCNYGNQPAGWKTRKGILYFPTIKGVTIINPQQTILNKTPPPVFIESVSVDGKPVDLSGNLILPSSAQSLQIYFSALSFSAPEKNQFNYKLTPHNKSWQVSSSREPVEYTNLPTGKYRFTIIACNNDHVWNYKGASFSFSKRAKFYQTFWFYALLTIILALAVFWIYKFAETRSEREAEREKKYKKSTLTPGRAESYLHRLLRIMDDEKPYLDEEISLESLADKMDVPRKHLSQVINEKLDQNFKNFINKYRIEEAKIKLLDPKEKDFVLLKIAFDVGFNSKSVFNAAFKKFTHLSPSEYRKKYYKSPLKEKHPDL